LEAVKHLKFMEYYCTVWMVGLLYMGTAQVLPAILMTCVSPTVFEE